MGHHRLLMAQALPQLLAAPPAVVLPALALLELAPQQVPDHQAVRHIRLHPHPRLPFLTVTKPTCRLLQSPSLSLSWP